MAVSLLDALTSLLATCKRHLSRAARKLRPAGSLSVLSSRSTAVPHAWGPKKRISLQAAKKKKREFSDEKEHGAVEHDHELWRKSILMGERCQPLDFSGVIYYDTEGRRLSEIPTPRSPLRSPLPSFALKVPITIADGKVGHE